MTSCVRQTPPFRCGVVHPNNDGVCDLSPPPLQTCATLGSVQRRAALLAATVLSLLRSMVSSWASWYSRQQQPTILQRHLTPLRLSRLSQICYDVRFPLLARRLAQAGVHVLLHPSAFPKDNTYASWHPFVMTRALENQVQSLLTLRA